MITDILFDNDGVLVDTEPLFFEVNRQVLQELGLDLSWEEFEEISLSDGQNVIRVKAANKIHEQDLLRCIQRRDQLFNAAISGQDLSKPGLLAIVKALAQRFRLTIVTGSIRSNLEAVHKKTGLLQNFYTVISCEDYEHPKPHPAPYLTAMGKLGVVSANCLAIEDSSRGLKSATSAGVQTIMFVEQSSSAQNIQGAVATCFSPDQIYQAIIRLSSKHDYDRGMGLE